MESSIMSEKKDSVLEHITSQWEINLSKSNLKQPCKNIDPHWRGHCSPVGCVCPSTQQIHESLPSTVPSPGAPASRAHGRGGGPNRRMWAVKAEVLGCQAALQRPQLCLTLRGDACAEPLSTQVLGTQDWPHSQDGAAQPFVRFPGSTQV